MSLLNRIFSGTNASKQKQAPQVSPQSTRAPKPSAVQQRALPNRQPQRAPQTQNHSNAALRVNVAASTKPNATSAQDQQKPNSNTPHRVPMRSPSAAQGRGTVYPKTSAPVQQRNVPVRQTAPMGPKPGTNAKTNGSTPGAQKPNVPSIPKNPTAPVAKKERAPIITAEGVRVFFFILLVSFVLYVAVCAVLFGAFYAFNNIHFDWNHEITVKLDKGVPKTENYITSEEVVFRNPSGEAYVNLTRIADSLSLSSIGGGNQIKFYKTNDLKSYAIFTSGSQVTVINGEEVRLSSPVYISNNSVYVPVGLFYYYTNGIDVTYDENERIMTVIYEVDEELSTPKRKVLKEFTFSVHAPQSIPEMTEKEWFEYVENAGS